MPKVVPTLGQSTQAKRMRKSGAAPEKFSPRKKSQIATNLERFEKLFQAEVEASLVRCVNASDAGEIGQHMDRGKTAVYDYRSGKSHLPGGKAFYLGIHDSDGDILIRLGNLFYQAAGVVAQARLKSGRMSVVIDHPQLRFEDEE